MALLLEGGIYTDTDTAPVTSITEWGRPYTTRTDPLLACLSTLLCPPLSPDDDGPLDEPSLILSVESDAIEFKWDDWRDVGLVRAVQIVQWTMAVRQLLRLPTCALLMRSAVGEAGSSGVYGRCWTDVTEDRGTGRAGTTSEGNGGTVQPS
jgi:hypothetical protein